MAVASVTHTFSAGTLIQSSQANTNFADLVAFLNGETIHKDASIAFTGVPSGPATDPTSDNQLTRKAYVDMPYVVMTRLSAATAPSAGAILLNSWTTVGSADVTVTNGGCVIQKEGLYAVSLGGYFDTGTGYRGLRLKQTGSGSEEINADRNSVATENPNGCYVHLNGVLRLEVGDGLECRYRHNAAGNITSDIRFSIHGIPGSMV